MRRRKVHRSYRYILGLLLGLATFVAGLLGGSSLGRLQAQEAPAKLQYPVAIAADANGRIYVADRNLPGVWTIADGKASVFFQGSKQFRTPLNAVRSLAVDNDGVLLAGDSSTREVYRFDDKRQPIPLTQGRIGIPMGIAVNKAGDIFVSDLESHRIWRIPAAGGDMEEFAEVAAPIGLAIDQEDHLWVVSRGDEQLLKLDSNGQSETIVSGRPFQFPHQVVVLEDGVALVTDGYGKKIWKVSPGEEHVPYATSDLFGNPVGLTRHKGGGESGDSELLVADPRSKSQILRVDSNGQVSPLKFDPGS